MKQRLMTILRVLAQSFGWVAVGFICGVIFEAVASSKTTLDQGIYFLIPCVVVATAIAVANIYENAYFIKYVLLLESIVKDIKNKKGGNDGDSN